MDLDNPLDQILEGQDNPATTANEVMDALSPSALYGRRAETSNLLTWGYYGGRADSVLIPHGTVTLTASDTNYIVANKATGAVSISTTITNWNDSTNYTRLYLVETDGTGPDPGTPWEDHRQVLGASAPIAGSVTAADVSFDDTGLSITAADVQEAIEELDAALAAGLADGDKGDIVVSAGATVWTIENDAVTYAKMQNISAASKLLGRGSAGGSGDTQEITVGSGLTMSGTTLTAAGDVATDVIFDAKGDLAVGTGANTAAKLIVGTNRYILNADSAEATGLKWVQNIQCIAAACSDETTALTATPDKVKFRMPYAFTLTDVRASVTTAPTGTGNLTVDIHESGTTILSTKLTFDASQKTTTTAGTPRVISDSSLANDAEISVDIDAVSGTITGAGLKIYLIGYPT